MMVDTSESANERALSPAALMRMAALNGDTPVALPLLWGISAIDVLFKLYTI